MRIVKNVLLAALAAPPCLLLLSACSFTPPTVVSSDVFTEGPDAIFCNIEEDRRCATESDDALVAMGIDLTKQEEAFLAGRSSRFGLDYSQEAVTECGGRPKIVFYQGAFPEGSVACTDAGVQLGIGKGLPQWSPGDPSVNQPVVDLNATCKIWCDAHKWIDKDGNQYNCDNIAWRAFAAESPVMNACTPSGTLRSDFVDLRRVERRDVVWTDRKNVGTQGNVLSRIQIPITPDWDARAASTSMLPSGDGYVEFTARETLRRRLAGLASVADLSNPAWTMSNIGFAIQLSEDGSISVVESGVTKYLGPPNTYQPGDVFRVAAVGGVVQYFRNGFVFYTSAGAPTYPLRAAAAFWDMGATIENARTVKFF